MNLPAKIDKDQTPVALLVVDVQLGMFESPLIPPVHDAENFLKRISRLIRQARSVEVPIIYIQHCGGKGHPLEEGTRAWQIHSAIQPKESGIVVRKRFCDSFYKTELQDILTSASIQSLVIAGIQTEFCVDTACRRAFSLGYKITLAEDGHSTWNNEYLKAEQIINHHNRTLGSSFVNLTRCESLFKSSTLKARG